ncbi:MAG: 50S ribosomal protein L11 methyltransferase, partial [Candidatus Buchananbacteria bacterium]
MIFFQIILVGLIFIIFIFGIIIGLLALASLGAIIICHVPYASTPNIRVKKIINLLDLKPDQKFYDLGCGDGRFLIEANRFGAKAVGFEISLHPYLLARINILQNHSQAKIIFKNFYEVDLSDADVVVCFLIDTVMAEVENKLIKELKPGAQVACYGFNLPHWQAKKIYYLNPHNK